MLEQEFYSKVIVKVLARFLMQYDEETKGKEPEYKNTYEMAQFIIQHLTATPSFVFNYENLRETIKGESLPEFKTYQALCNPPHRACTFITQFSDSTSSIMAGALFGAVVIDTEKYTDYVHLIIPKVLWENDNYVANPVVFSMIMHCVKGATHPFEENPILAAGINRYVANQYIKGQHDDVSMFHSATAVMAYCLKHCEIDVKTTVVDVDLLMSDGTELESVSPYHEVTVLKENSESIILH